MKKFFLCYFRVATLLLIGRNYLILLESLMNSLRTRILPTLFMTLLRSMAAFKKQIGS